MSNPAEVLLVDDNPADLELTCDALERSGYPHHISTVADGREAVLFLWRKQKYAGACRADLVILDLNLPRKDGRAVLAELKSDPRLRATPVVIFSTSQAAQDIGRSYELGANSYVSKPGNLKDFFAAMQLIARFWFGCARLPHSEES